MEFYSAIRKKGILPFEWMDLEGIMLSEMLDRERQMYDFTYMWNLRNKVSKIETESENRQLTEWKGAREPAEKGEGIKKYNLVVTD